MDSLVGGFFSLVFLKWDFLPAVQVKKQSKMQVTQEVSLEYDWNTLGDFSKANKLSFKLIG